MGNSLFDQLKKSGLVDDKKAKKVKQSLYTTKKNKGKKGATSSVDEATLSAQKTQIEKVERDRQLNQLKVEKAERKALVAQIKQLIETNRIQNSDGDVVYNFVDAGVIKKIYISEQIHKYLVSGSLAIARLGDEYVLVPRPVADKIKKRDDQWIIQSTDSKEDVVHSADDPYADYQIPDDIMW